MRAHLYALAWYRERSKLRKKKRRSNIDSTKKDDHIHSPGRQRERERSPYHVHFNFNRFRIQNCSIGQGKRSNMKQANLRRPPSSSFACSLRVISNKERQSRLPLRTATLQFTPDPCHSSSFALLYSLTLSFSRAIKSGGNTTAQQDLKKKKKASAHVHVLTLPSTTPAPPTVSWTSTQRKGAVAVC